MLLNRHIETLFNGHPFLSSAQIPPAPSESPVATVQIPSLIDQVTEIVAAESQPKRIKIRSGEKDFPERNSLKSLSLNPLLQIEKIASIEIPHNTAEYSKPAYNFMIRTLKPIKGCLTNHFNGDANAFLEKWKSPNGTLGYSRFSDKCKGVGNICSQ